MVRAGFLKVGSVAIIGLLGGIACQKDSSSAPAAPGVPNKLRYEASVPAEQIAALNDSISAIYSLRIDSSNEQLKQIMKVPNLEPETLQSWLEARVHYVVSNNFDYKSAVYEIKGSGFEYPNRNELPDVGVPSSNFLVSADQDKDTVMTNLGGLIYWILKKASIEKSEKSTSLGANGKKEQLNIVAGLRLPGIGDVPVKSPRVGILLIGPGLFPNVDPAKVSPEVLQVFRAGTLFHEARHSDGHGRSLSFLHTRCPEGHSYADKNACDASLNGPYTVGAMIHKAMMDACNNQNKCTGRAREGLRVMYLDFADRVVKGRVRVKDRVPPEFTAVPTEWDDAPEGTLP